MITRPANHASRIIVSIDTTDLQHAQNFASAIRSHVGLIKLGLEFFGAHGLAGVQAVTQGQPFFLDLKFHDIPNTVAGAVRAVLPCAPAMCTIHASGGPAMISAARKAAEGAGAARPMILAVTVLTSIDADTLSLLGVQGSPAQQVQRLARVALDAGADGLVCSAHEARILRDTFGESPALVVPGIRPVGSDVGDQARVMTPPEAVAAGADWLVIGRPITAAPDPLAAARAIAASLG